MLYTGKEKLALKLVSLGESLCHVNVATEEAHKRKHNYIDFILKTFIRLLEKA